MNPALSDPANAEASSVFPFPGGPKSRTDDESSSQLVDHFQGATPYGLGYFRCVLRFVAEISNGVFKFSVLKQKLNRSSVVRLRPNFSRRPNRHFDHPSQSNAPMALSTAYVIFVRWERYRVSGMSMFSAKTKVSSEHTNQPTCQPTSILVLLNLHPVFDRMLQLAPLSLSIM